MKIKTRMLLTLFLFGLIVLMTAVSLVFSIREIERLTQQEVIVRNIENSARELSYLSNDYLLNRETQQHDRWQIRFNVLHSNLEQLSLDNPLQQVLVDQIRTNTEHLETVFSEIVTRIESEQASTPANGDELLVFAQISWSRLEVQNQSIISKASQLTLQIHDQQEELRQRNLQLIYILAGILTAYLVINYFFIYRRMARSMADLQAGIRTISAGDLSYVINEDQPDEFGELAAAFNQMTAALREITAAKAELVREMAERQMSTQQAEFDTQMEVQRRLSQQREMERLDIARDLHDGVLQELTLIGFTLTEAIHLDDKNSRIEKLKWVQENLQKQVSEIRAFCNQLRPPALAPFGLEKAIRSHIEEYQARYPALKIHLNLHADRQTLPEGTRMALFRVFQEVMNNIARHSKASQVWITWSLDDQEACLEIKDDGVGFEVPNDWVVQARSGHLGLVGMRERVLAIGGEILTDSQPGQGARVQVKIPRNGSAG